MVGRTMREAELKAAYKTAKQALEFFDMVDSQVYSYNFVKGCVTLRTVISKLKAMVEDPEVEVTE